MHLTDHCYDRCIERKIPVELLYEAISQGHQMKSHRNPGQIIYTHGDLRVIARPKAHLILTCYIIGE